MDHPCKRYAVHAWRHVDVTDDYADIGTTFEVLDRLLGVRRLKGQKPRFLNHIDGIESQKRVIFNHQSNRFTYLLTVPCLTVSKVCRLEARSGVTKQNGVLFLANAHNESNAIHGQPLPCKTTNNVYIGPIRLAAVPC